MKVIELRLFGSIGVNLLGGSNGLPFVSDSITAANVRSRRQAGEVAVTETDLDVERRDAPAEGLLFAGASFDTVVGTLALCTLSVQSEGSCKFRLFEHL